MRPPQTLMSTMRLMMSDAGDDQPAPMTSSTRPGRRAEQRIQVVRVEHVSATSRADGQRARRPSAPSGPAR